MNNELLCRDVLNLINDSKTEVLLIDVFNDLVTSFNYLDGKFSVKEKVPFTSYLETVKTNVSEEYLKDYMNALSIPKLKENLKNGIEKVSVTYKTLNNKSYTNISKLINNSSSDLILLVIKENSESTKDNDATSLNVRFNSLVDLVADSIIKVQNIFSLDEKSLSNTKNLEEYISSVFNNLTSSYEEVKKAVNKTYLNVTSRKDDVILIIDDDMITRNMIKKIFDGIYKTIMLSNGKEALEYLEENKNKGLTTSSDHIVAIFLDLTMPVLDGFAVLEYLSKKNYLTKIPVVIISGDYEKETKARVYNYNIADMLEKPFDFEIVKHRISNFINLYKSSNSLNNLVNNQNEEIIDLINPFVEAYLYDYKDNIEHVKTYIDKLAIMVMKDYPEYNLTLEKIEKMKDASKYYDVGFYSIPRSILSKNGNWNKEEIKKIKEYPLFTSSMINYLLSSSSDSLFKEYSINIAKYYHENYDGTGYPNGLVEDEIPIESQIASIAIMYNNLRRKGLDKAESIIVSKSGKMFNPKLIESFAKVTF